MLTRPKSFYDDNVCIDFIRAWGISFRIVLPDICQKCQKFMNYTNCLAILFEDKLAPKKRLKSYRGVKMFYRHFKKGKPAGLLDIALPHAYSSYGFHQVQEECFYEPEDIFKYDISRKNAEYRSFQYEEAFLYKAIMRFVKDKKRMCQHPFKSSFRGMLSHALRNRIKGFIPQYVDVVSRYIEAGLARF